MTRFSFHTPGNGPPAMDDGVVERQYSANWSEVLRLATSIRSGAVQASAMLKKLSGYPRQNGLAVALRDIGRIERSLFMLGWYSDPELRRRTGLGLNKGEARNTLARATDAGDARRRGERLVRPRRVSRPGSYRLDRILRSACAAHDDAALQR